MCQSHLGFFHILAVVNNAVMLGECRYLFKICFHFLLVYTQTWLPPFLYYYVFPSVLFYIFFFFFFLLFCSRCPPLLSCFPFSIPSLTPDLPHSVTSTPLLLSPQLFWLSPILLCITTFSPHLGSLSIVIFLLLCHTPFLPTLWHPQVPMVFPQK